MRFLDSSTFLYAYLKPTRDPPPEIAQDKKIAQTIITRVNRGEKALTTASHVSEISNILEARSTLMEANAITSSIIETENIEVTSIDVEKIRNAVHIAERFYIGVNDGLAIDSMRENSINEIYSRKKHFDNIPGIQRIWI
jgi:hypothetical protein